MLMRRSIRSFKFTPPPSPPPRAFELLKILAPKRRQNVVSTKVLWNPMYIPDTVMVFKLVIKSAICTVNGM